MDPYVILAGLIVGLTVGLTGMGGGALMTPILVLLFKVEPLAAVSSDLVAAMVMKPVGGAVHVRRGTVNRDLVLWLSAGSVPAAFGGVLVLKSMGSSAQLQERLTALLGVALLLAAASMVVKSVVQARRLERERAAAAEGRAHMPAPFVVRPWPTVLVGATGGLVVGMTSVGSGSLVIIMLMVLYPMLAMRQLVGTDLVQAVPLVASAALGHLLFGDFRLDVTASLLVGSLPGVYVGARLSSRAPDAVVRPALVFVLLASALKLLDVPTPETGILLLAFVLVALPVWGVLDAMGRPIHHWAAANLSRARWIALQAAGAPFGVGFGAAVAYFLRVRPRVSTAGVLSLVAVYGDEVAV